jgi:hypothetical protein
MNQDLFKSTLEIIQKDFELTVGVSESQIKEFLTAALVQLLLHDLEKLWNILYRIDVDELKVKAVFNASDPKEIAPKLAELIYKRAEQKALTRLKYGR